MLRNHDQIFPDLAFNLVVWNAQNIGSPDSILRERSFYSPKEYKKARDCGTAACALGSACYYKPFKKLGLKMDKSWDIPSYKKENGFEAGMKFFGLTRAENERLFDVQYYKKHPSPKQVAKKVDRLINKYSKGTK